MSIVIMPFIVSFAAVIFGAVSLIQVGGWLNTLSAILIILHFFISAGLMACLAATLQYKKEQKKEGEKHERMGD